MCSGQVLNPTGEGFEGKFTQNLVEVSVSKMSLSCTEQFLIGTHTKGPIYDAHRVACRETISYTNTSNLWTWFQSQLLHVYFDITNEYRSV